MPKHFQTLALQHWFMRFIAPTPKVFSLGGRRGPENARVSTRGRLGTDICDGQTKWRRKTT